MRALPVVMILGLLLPFTAAAQGILGVDSAPEGPRLDRVVITGNHRVEEEAIRVQIRSQPGTRLNEETVDSDVRALYRMGFFDNVEAELNEENGKWVLTYKVTERPLIHEVHIEGQQEAQPRGPRGGLQGAPEHHLRARQGAQRHRRGQEAVREEGLPRRQHHVRAPSRSGEDEVVLTYKIDEGKVVRISDLVFEGARAFTPSELRKVMQTKESWIFSFITGAGNLDNEVLKTDIERLTAFYYDHGYIDVKIDEPVVEREKDGLKVTIKIDEGEQYKVGKVDISGDLLPDMTKARAKLSLAPGEVFRTSKLRDDISALTEIYGDEGYAFVNVTPDTAVDQADKTVDVTYKVSKGPAVTIDKIDITGNTKTRDKVIRRELRLQEQQRFSGSALRKSQERLRRLGYFEDVNITTRKADSEDRLDLLVDVKEASTGSFSAGAGISSGENFLFNVRLSEINLFGRGQRLVLNVDFGQLRRNFSVDFTEPYFLDTELTAGFSLFKWQLFFDQFTRGGTGAAVRFLYPFTALGLDRCRRLLARRHAHRPGVPHRASRDQRRQHGGRHHHPNRARHQPHQQPHAAAVPRHPQPSVRSDQRLTAGSVLRVGRARRPEQVHQGGSARRAGTIRSIRARPGGPSCSHSGPTSATVSATAASATCRCSSATSPAASTRCAATRFSSLGPKNLVINQLGPRHQPRPDRRQLAADLQQRDHLSHRRVAWARRASSSSMPVTPSRRPIRLI